MRFLPELVVPSWLGVVDGLKLGVLLDACLRRTGVRTKPGIDMVQPEESGGSRLSKEERTGPEGKPSSQKFPCRAVVGSRPFPTVHTFRGGAGYKDASSTNCLSNFTSNKRLHFAITRISFDPPQNQVKVPSQLYRLDLIQHFACLSSEQSLEIEQISEWTSSFENDRRLHNILPEAKCYAVSLVFIRKSQLLGLAQFFWLSHREKSKCKRGIVTWNLLNQDFPTAVMINCCFCVDLRKGCIIVGILDMVLYSLILATNCMQLIEMKWQLTEKVLIQDIDSWDEELDCSENVIGAVDSVLGISVCITLVIGAIHVKPGLLLPWLMAAVLSMVYYSIAKVLFVGPDGFTVLNAVFLLRIILTIYFFMVVYGFFKKVLTERQRSYLLIADLSIGEIISAHSIRELHLSLTQGLWRTHKWGYPARYAGLGAEVSATFPSHLTSDQVDSSWVGLVNSLSGLLCASFNFVTMANTIQPRWTFTPEGLNLDGGNSSHIRYANLPREIVCTENLTPWKKLLPCESHSGLGELLDAKHMYNSNYHSLALDLRPVCRNKKCQDSSLELKLSLSLVSEPTVMHGSTTDGIKSDWSFKTLFGVHLFSSCPRAQTSKVYIDVTSNMTNQLQWEVKPTHDGVITNQRGGSTVTLAVYDLKARTKWPINVRGVYSKKTSYGIIPQPLVHATRFVGGHGQAKGKLITRVHNNYHSSDIDMVLLELVPWYCRVFLHTLSFTNSKNKPVGIDKQEKLYFRPGLDRQRPHHLELRVKLPANSVTEIEWEFQKGFLKWTEYPPDAHRGFDLGPAVITAVLPVARNWTGIPRHMSTWNVSQAGYLVRLHTEALVLAMATPDFSMPYNVICLACTVVALAFGPLYNLTTKRLVLKESRSAGGLTARLRTILQRNKQSPAEESKEKSD
uniref:EOG090X043F n=1 Tax=Moina brachiata TaxID=675436 RepID=A0A4Y7NK19_9CRUS|nr:EOG090X043F [Moina brachiata]